MLRSKMMAVYLGVPLLALLTDDQPAHARVVVDCSSGSINQAIADAAPATPTTIDLSGTCTESVLVPSGKIITINGAAGTVVKAKGSNPTALKVEGQLTVNNLSIRSGKAAGGSLVQVGDIARFYMQGSSASSSVAQLVIQAYTNSAVVIENSTVSGGLESTLEVSNNSLAFVFASGGKTTTLKNPDTSFGQVIGCWHGQVTLTTFDDNSKVVIGPSGRVVIGSRGCNADIGSYNNNAQPVTITGGTDGGIEAKSGDTYGIHQTIITGNGGYGLQMSAGVAEIDKSSITSNANGLWAGRGSTIYFNTIQGPNTVSGANPYSCYQGGAVYADPGAITGAVSTNCLTVGGPTKH